MINMKKWVLLLFLAAGAGLSYYFFLRPTPAQDEVSFEFAEVIRGNVEDIVSATGTVAARDSVDIGTQVSGTIREVLVDFNDTVTAGQLLARLDTETLDAQVKSAEAEVMRAEAQLEKAESDLNRSDPLFQKGIISEHEIVPFRTAVKTARASLLQAEANLDRAVRNRGYAEIYSPIDGVVLERAVEPGQTVAASLNTPRLFIIAEDLAKMEIMANVDESDIGRVEVGQRARFGVAAYPDLSFEAVVEEIRLQPQVIQNVVNYTVVLSTENRRGRLLPGMTALVDFVVAEASSVLTVPSSAFNLRLTPEMEAVLAQRREDFRAQREASGANRSDPTGTEQAPREEQRRGPGGGFTGNESGQRDPGLRRPGGPGAGFRAQLGVLWVREDTGAFRIIPVRKGITNGTATEVISLGQDIPEGLKVVTRVNTRGSAVNSTRNSLLPSRPGGGPGRRIF